MLKNTSQRKKREKTKKQFSLRTVSMFNRRMHNKKLKRIFVEKKNKNYLRKKCIVHFFCASGIHPRSSMNEIEASRLANTAPVLNWLCNKNKTSKRNTSTITDSFFLYGCDAVLQISMQYWITELALNNHKTKKTA